jgi:predicted acyltransferase
MLLVNNPGHYTMVYAPLDHAEWHGWTPTDLIFPFFLFIVGVALTFSLRRQPDRGVSHTEILGRAARRTLVLIALGLLIVSYPWWHTEYLSTLRLPGVLQRIGLAYFAATAIVLFTAGRAHVIAMVTLALLLGYWALLSWVPVPDIGAGVWEPGKDLGAFIDRAVFGTDHLSDRTWDSEGLLSTLPVIGTVLLGVLAGQWLGRDGSARRKVAGLLAAGAAGVALGLLWGQVFPINKSLWTSSYALFTAGIALVLFAACYWLVDVKGLQRWAYPFVVLGVNPITVYVLSELVHRILGRIRIPWLGIRSLRHTLYEHLFASWLSPLNASLAFAIAYALVWLGIMAVLYRKGIRLSV